MTEKSIIRKTFFFFLAFGNFPFGRRNDKSSLISSLPPPAAHTYTPMASGAVYRAFCDVPDNGPKCMVDCGRQQHDRENVCSAGTPVYETVSSNASGRRTRTIRSARARPFLPNTKTACPKVSAYRMITSGKVRTMWFDSVFRAVFAISSKNDKNTRGPGIFSFPRTQHDRDSFGDTVVVRKENRVDHVSGKPFKKTSMSAAVKS